MKVYIKDLKLPVSCGECRLQIDIDGYRPVCVAGKDVKFNGGIGIEEKYKHTRHEKCPLRGEKE